MRAHILIVEDEPLLYRRMSKVLEKENYTVADYTPSVKAAIAKINVKRPDIVLLDIDLQGEETGLDLGRQLSNTYKIPFIYITDYDDNQTFFQGLETNHEHFMVKTKPRLDIKELIRTIQTVIHKQKVNKEQTVKGNVIGLVDYLENVRNYGEKGIVRVPFSYDDIAFFTTSSFINKKKEREYVKSNYMWFLTEDKQTYFLYTSLAKIYQGLPYNFVRISESYIINILPEFLDGRINGSRLSIMGHEVTVSKTYKKEFKKRFDFFYNSK